jgi:DNA polymerase-3 subunit epsilon
MAEALPALPGVYIFRGHQGEPLYIGTSKNIRSRVKTYFTSGEQRRAIREMLEIAESVEGRPVATELEANVTELRLLDEHRPRYNRRSTRPDRTIWVRLTDEPYPRLSVVRSVSEEAVHIGPMSGATAARTAVEALQEVLPVRTCLARLPRNPRSGARACILKDLGSCSAPCVSGEAEGYSEVVEALRGVLSHDPSPVIAALAERIDDYAGRLEYERAADLRNGISALVQGATDAQNFAALRRCTIVAARPEGQAWDVILLSRGWLAGSRKVSDPAPANLEAAADALLEGHADRDARPLPGEVYLAIAWLAAPDVRLLRVEGEWSQPVRGAGRHRSWVEARRDDRAQVWDAHAGPFPRI